MKLHWLIFIFTFVNLTSCSPVRIHSNKDRLVTFDTSDGYMREVSFEVERNFYLWGHVPGQQDIDLALEAKDRGYGGLADISITEKYSTKNWLLPILSLGLYIPKTYVVRARVRAFKK